VPIDDPFAIGLRPPHIRGVSPESAIPPGQYPGLPTVYPGMADAVALTRRAVEGDRGLNDAVRAHGPRLRAFVRRQVADLAEADDIVQDTLLELVSAYRLMEPIEHLAAWLVRVARNRIVDRFRARARTVTVGELDLVEEGAEPPRVLDAWLSPATASPEAAYARAVLGDELLAALDELPDEQRRVFIAHEVDGQSFKDLSAETGIGINTLLGR
jgi:RNA polymerase sigma factor (sigma-70 family)